MIQWIPSYRNIKGNDMSDLAAKKAHGINRSKLIPQNPKCAMKGIELKNCKQRE